MNTLLEKQVVEEAVLLAETIAAVESNKDPGAAEDVSSYSILNSCSKTPCMYMYMYMY